MLLHVLFLHLGVMRPNFGNDGVLSLVIFYGYAVRSVFLNGIFDLVELFAHVIGGVVLRGRGSWVAVPVKFSSAMYAPQESRGQGEDPEHYEDGAEQRNQVVCFGARCLMNAYTGNGLDDGAVTIVLAQQVNDRICNVFLGSPLQPLLFRGNADVNLIGSCRRWVTGDGHGILRCEVLQQVPMPQLIAYMFYAQALRHVLLVKGECDVGTAVVLVREAAVAFGGWRRCWGPAFSKARAGFDKAVFVLDGNTRLPDWTTTSAISYPT